MAARRIKRALMRVLLIPAGLGFFGSSVRASENTSTPTEPVHETAPHRLAILQSLLGSELVPGDFSGHAISGTVVKQHVAMDEPRSPPVGPPP